MIIVDTSVWISYFRREGLWDDSLKQQINLLQVLALEPIFAELLQGAKSKKEIRMIETFWKLLPKMDEQGLWIKAGQSANGHKWCSRGVGIIDAFIICAARKTHAKIWSLDKKLNAQLGKEEKFMVL